MKKDLTGPWWNLDSKYTFVFVDVVVNFEK